MILSEGNENESNLLLFYTVVQNKKAKTNVFIYESMDLIPRYSYLSANHNLNHSIIFKTLPTPTVRPENGKISIENHNQYCQKLRQR